MSSDDLQPPAGAGDGVVGDGGGDDGYGGGDSAGNQAGGPPRRHARARTAFGAGGWARRLAKLWGFLGFCILVLFLARNVILPFVFALLIAYILAPVVHRMSTRSDGGRRMPKPLAIIICYIVLIAFMVMFVVILMPRLSKDVARIGGEAPNIYKKLNEVWAPKMGRWLEKRFPSLAPAEPKVGDSPVVDDVPLPPGTSFVLTPLPDGRFAVVLSATGLVIDADPSGGYLIAPQEDTVEGRRVEDKIRAWATKALKGMQSQLGDLFRFSRAVISGFVRSIFTFFLVLMVAAFILLDLEKLHAFARSLFPVQNRPDYDVIVKGIDRGLSGVIRGQHLFCLVNGIFTYIGLLIFDVKYSLILATVAAMLSLIPIFGSILSSIPIVLVALVSGDEGVDFLRGIFILAWIVGIHFVEANLLNPKIIGTAAKIHPVLVIFSLIVGEHSYGLVGALLAVPVASIIQVFFLFFRRKAWKTEAGAAPAQT